MLARGGATARWPRPGRGAARGAADGVDGATPASRCRPWPRRRARAGRRAGRAPAAGISQSASCAVAFQHGVHGRSPGCGARMESWRGHARIAAHCRAPSRLPPRCGDLRARLSAAPTPLGRAGRLVVALPPRRGPAPPAPRGGDEFRVVPRADAQQTPCEVKWLLERDTQSIFALHPHQLRLQAPEIEQREPRWLGNLWQGARVLEQILRGRAQILAAEQFASPPCGFQVRHQQQRHTTK